MRVIIIVMGFLAIGACGMPDMPDRVPIAERQAQASGGSAAGANNSSEGAVVGDTESAEEKSPQEPSSSVGASASSGTSASASTVTAPKPSTYVKATALPLVINEILYDLPGDDTNGDLFVELRGTPGGDLGGYKVNFLNGDDGKETEHVTIPAGLLVPENGLFVIADGITGDLQHTHVPNADYLDNFDPQNGPDSVQLLSPDGKLVDAVSYGSPKVTTATNGMAMLEGTAAPDSPLSKSISRLTDAEDTHNNSADFVVNTVPSPGEYDVAGAL